MINITDKKKCCGCTACSSACPKNCIEMAEDNEGFLYPKVNIDLCVNCNVCEAVCPMLKSIDETDIPETYVARDIRKDILLLGTSGSVFTSIMERILASNGVVYGVVVDDDNVVRHIRINYANDKNISKIPCSKYVRSDILGIFKKIKCDLDKKFTVCFSGTPCQVAGLKSFLNKEYENLITIDVVCRGNPSPLFFKKFIKYLEERYKSKIVDIRFRNKTYGYHSGTMRVAFKNGKIYSASARSNFFLRAFFEDLCSRPSCYMCHFKHIRHMSDLTLYDSWHAAELADIKDDDRGYTNIIVQSKKGKELLNQLDMVEKYSINTQKAIELDGIMVENSVVWSQKRKNFFDNIEDENIKSHCLKFIDISFKDYFIEWAKKFYYF